MITPFRRLTMEELLQLMENTANMLRGMTMDPAVPAHAKEAMGVRIVALEDAVEKYA